MAKYDITATRIVNPKKESIPIIVYELKTILWLNILDILRLRQPNVIFILKKSPINRKIFDLRLRFCSIIHLSTVQYVYYPQIYLILYPT